MNGVADDGRAGISLRWHSSAPLPALGRSRPRWSIAPIAWSTGAIALPALDFAERHPRGHAARWSRSPRCLRAKPTCWSRSIGWRCIIYPAQAERLSFALLTDGIDADSRVRRRRTLRCCSLQRVGIAALNAASWAGPDGRQRFFLLHRRRAFNASEGIWMGWERKRGKLHELNRLAARRADRHELRPIEGERPCRRPVSVTSSHWMPTRGCHATPHAKLIGKMAHPLNRPRNSIRRHAASSGGYGILQPPGDAVAAHRARGVRLSTRLFRPGRNRPVRRRELRRVPGPASARDPTPARESTTSMPSRPRMLGRVPDNTAAQPRPVRGHFRAGRAGLGHRSRRGISIALRRCRARASIAGPVATGNCIPWVFGIVHAQRRRAFLRSAAGR